jgi:formylglycine-generating enzyme required for sulfatase activity
MGPSARSRARIGWVAGTPLAATREEAVPVRDRVGPIDLHGFTRKLLRQASAELARLRRIPAVSRRTAAASRRARVSPRRCVIVPRAASESLLVLAALLVALPATAVNIKWVYIGDPANPPDTGTNCYADNCGSVPYGYYISKYEVTNAQYAEFLNAVAASDPLELWDESMSKGIVDGDLVEGVGITRSGTSGSYTYAVTAGFENRPVAAVTFYEALRFVNWLHNRQGDGDTETGAYTLLGGAATPSNGTTVARNPDARIFLPSENEWYKAAYYDASSATYDPYPFADGFDGGLCEPPPGATTHSANCVPATSPWIGLTEVGAYTSSPSAYGTFDQGGNVWEWNEEYVGWTDRGLRGGPPSDALAASSRESADSEQHVLVWGFRVATLVPEPAQPLTRTQQRCVVDLNSAGWDAVRAQAKDTRRCLSRASKGKETDAQACIAADERGRLARAEQGTGKAESRSCDPAALPGFAYAGSGVVYDAGVAASRALTAALFGPDLGAAAALRSASPTAAACQAKVQKRADVLLDALSSLANRAKADGLRGKKMPPVESADALAQHLLAALAADANGKLARAETRLGEAASAKCGGADLAALFPGYCAGAATPAALTACAADRARCRFCQALERFDALELGCELFDDGANNTSCGGSPPPPAGPVVRYDRTDTGQLGPLPDDFWVVEDATTRTGLRVELEVPDREPDVQKIFQALIVNTAGMNGFSPIGPIGVELSEPVDPTSIPISTQESLDPQASLGLVDLTPGSPTFAVRVPFHTSTPSFAYPGQEARHALVVFPSIPLTPGGRYGFFVTRGARTASGQKPFGPSAFFEDALSPAKPGEPPELARVRALAGEVLDGLALADPPLTAEDLVLALRFSVRSTDDVPRDPLRMREQVHALPPPPVTILDVQPGTGPVAAIVQGTFEAPLWLEGPSLKRDVAGDPVIAEMQTIPFLLALPVAALGGPAPLTIVQHGSPGTFQDVILNADTHLAAGGFAAIGITDAMNRLVGPNFDDQLVALFGNLYLGARIADCRRT